MLRYAVLSAILTISLSPGLAGQQPGTETQANTSTVPSASTETTQNPETTRSDTSSSTAPLPPTPMPPTPMLATPMATFASPVPTAGISNAGRAGISNNAPMNTGVTNTLPSTPLVYTTGSTVIGVETNPATASAGGTNTANTEEEKSVRDLAPSYFENAVSGGNSASLGEVASHLKSARGMLNTRMFTNEHKSRMPQPHQTLHNQSRVQRNRLRQLPIQQGHRLSSRRVRPRPRSAKRSIKARTTMTPRKPAVFRRHQPCCRCWGCSGW